LIRIYAMAGRTDDALRAYARLISTLGGPPPDIALRGAHFRSDLTPVFRHPRFAATYREAYFSSGQTKATRPCPPGAIAELRTMAEAAGASGGVAEGQVSER
jgi:hypothetical protein